MRRSELTEESVAYARDKSARDKYDNSYVVQLIPSVRDLQTRMKEVLSFQLLSRTAQRRTIPS